MSYGLIQGDSDALRCAASNHANGKARKGANREYTLAAQRVHRIMQVHQRLTWCLHKYVLPVNTHVHDAFQHSQMVFGWSYAMKYITTVRECG